MSKPDYLKEMTLSQRMIEGSISVAGISIPGCLFGSVIGSIIQINYGTVESIIGAGIGTFAVGAASFYFGFNGGIRAIAQRINKSDPSKDN